MDFFGKLNAKNTFGMFEQGKGNNIVNIICGVLLIILIIVLIVCLVRNNDKFSNQKENDSQEIHMYHVVNSGCPFSRKMSELLEQNNNMIGGSKVKDITMEHPLAKGVTGTPTIICIKTGKKSVGFKPLDKVLEDLKDNSNESHNSGKDILLVGSMGCGFCIKAKELMEELGLDYEFVESNSPHGLRHMKDNNANGVPLILKLSTNKTINGFNEQEIRNLKN